MNFSSDEEDETPPNHNRSRTGAYSHPHQPREHRTGRGQDNNEGTHSDTTMAAGNIQHGNNQTRGDPTNTQQEDDSRPITTPQMIRQTHLRPQRQIEGEEDDVARDEDPDKAGRAAELGGQHASNPAAAAAAAATTTPTSWLHQSPQYVQVHIGNPENSSTSIGNVHAELTKTNLTVCKRCRQRIKKGDMRIGINSTDLQGEQIIPWYHKECWNSTHNTHTQPQPYTTTPPPSGVPPPPPLRGRGGDNPPGVYSVFEHDAGVPPPS